MSDMERNKGKLIPVEIETEHLTTDDIDDLVDNDFVRIDGDWYRVEFEVRGESDFPEFADVTENEDGTIYFHTYHYNGGGHWTELVEEELSK